MAGAVPLRRFILGLLARQSMSGYDIKRFLKSLGWLIDSPSFGSLYPALHALLEDGLVTVEVIPRDDKPARKIYSITEIGKRVLREWIEQPVVQGASLKAFLMRLILAGNLSHAGLLAHLRQRRADVAAHQIALQKTTGMMGGGTDLGERLAFDYVLAVAAVELAWLDRTLDRLSQSPSPVEATQSDFATVTV